MTRRFYGIIGTLIVAGLLVLLASSINWQQVWVSLQNADYRYFVPAFGLTIAALITRAMRWYWLLDRRLPFLRCFHISNIGYLLNSAIPLRLGEVARMVLAARGTQTVPMVTSLSTIFIERILDLLALLMMLALALLLIPVAASVTVTTLLVGAGSAVALIVLVVMAHRPQWVQNMMAWALARFPFLERLPLAPLLQKFLDGLTALGSWRILLGVLWWSALSWLLTLAVGYVLLYAFFPQSDFAAVILYTAMSSLAVAAASAVSYVPSAVGPYQASVVVALGIAGFTQPEGAPLAFAIVLHLTNVGAYVLLGIWGIIQEDVSLQQLRRWRGEEIALQKEATGGLETPH